MKTLSLSLSITETEPCNFNTEYGFSHVVTSDGLTIQCCLMLRKNGNGYKKQIDINDCGANDGICGDVNSEAFEKYGKEACLKFLFKHIRKLGVKIV